jgi:HD-like signal output (HDOD) protein
MGKATDRLTEWVERISKKEMPVFDRTVRQIIEVAHSQKAPAAELANVILRDPSLTARILKLANSTYYYHYNKQRGGRINTVTRAVVVLGFDTVYNMCLAISLIDSMVQGEPREQLIRELARSIHAATQARNIAFARGDDSPEEIYIAALLYHLGELAFWCFGGKSRDQLLKAMRQPHYEKEAAERDILGFSLAQLTAGLSREWQLSPLLTDAITHPRAAGKRGANVILSYRLAMAAEKGWGDPEVERISEELASLAGLNLERMVTQLHQNAHEASQVAAYFGAAQAAEVIPLPETATEGEPEPESPEVVIEAGMCPEPNGMLQLRILRELSMLLNGKPDSNVIMELVLEGIYRGIGMDRTLFALLTPDRRGLRAKYAMGPEAERFAGAFHFTRVANQPNLLFHTIDHRTAYWADSSREADLSSLLPQSVTRVVGKAPFYIAPIVVSSQSIGLFYADRTPSGRSLDEESFESFKHFVEQANLGLSHLSRSDS